VRELGPDEAESTKVWSRQRWLTILLVVLLPPLLLRGCVLSTYVIRSTSMEPAIQTGDHLLVLKEGVDLRELKRWDVGLFDRSIDLEVPEEIEAVAKRIVGLPGEMIELRDGDVFVGPNKARLSLVQKEDALVRRLLVPVDRGPGLTQPWSGPSLEVDADGTRISAGAQELWALYGVGVRDGVGEDLGRWPVRDTALEVVVGEGDGTLLLQLREGADTFQARLAPADRGGALLGHNLGQGKVCAEPQFPGLRPGQRVLFWNVDNGVRLWIDDEILFSYDYPENASLSPGGALNNVPGVGVVDGTLSLREVAVLRDLHYAPQGDHGTALGPARIPEGQLFLLGDNSRKSRDSRYFGPKSITLLRGRPFATYRPLSRAGWRSAAGVAP
jgi:signal peptidase I